MDRVGGPQDRATYDPALVGVNIRHDHGRLDPLPQVPVAQPSAADAPVADPEPVPEAARRQRLVDALATRKTALAALERAQQAHLRGRQHIADCQKRAAAFVGLERDIALAVTVQLRDTDGNPVLGDFEAALHDRAVADAALTAAAAAEQTLLAEHAKATTTWQAADRAVKAALDQIAAIPVGRLRDRQRALDAESNAIGATMAALVISEDHGLGRRLIADPLGADIDIAVDPDAKPSVRPVRITNHTVRLMNSDGSTTDPVSEHDWFAAQRAARLAAAGDAESFAIREQRAKALANRPIDTDGEAA
jgi:hypothetical protein